MNTVMTKQIQMDKHELELSRENGAKIQKMGVSLSENRVTIQIKNNQESLPT